MSRQSKELAAQLIAVRQVLAESRALLQQPLYATNCHRAPPLSPSSSPLDLDEKPAERETAATVERLDRPPPPLAGSSLALSFATAVKSRLSKYRRACLVALCLIAILAVLEDLFDIDHPLTGGKNHSLFFHAWVAHASQPR